MSNKQGQDSLPSYMDGVKVKISERYKPPPRIILPMSYSQRLLLNKQIQDSVGHYDFSLEKTVKERMKEWRNARSVTADEHKQKLVKIMEIREKALAESVIKRDEQVNKEDNVKNEEQRTAFVKDTNFTNYLSNSNVLIPTLATTNCTDMLMPMPLSKLNSQPYICKPTDKSPFNISDFEADTSSPFDNVELKTINDMAELALVLQNDDKKLDVQQYPYIPANTNSYPYSNYNTHDMGSSQYSYISQLPTTSTSAYIQPPNSNQANGYYYTSNTFQANTCVTPYTYSSNRTECNSFDTTSPQNVTEDKLPFRSVPDIMKALQTELNHTHINNMKYNKINHSINVSNHLSNTSKQKSPGSTKSYETQSDDLEDPYKSLPKNLQQLSKTISGMGFPLPRVARACKLLGDDHKKVVEHLLAMTELLDLGFSENRVSSALLKCNNDRDKALDMLIL